jgi:hypothetical protein
MVCLRNISIDTPHKGDTDDDDDDDDNDNNNNKILTLLPLFLLFSSSFSQLFLLP